MECDLINKDKIWNRVKRYIYLLLFLITFFIVLLIVILYLLVRILNALRV